MLPEVGFLFCPGFGPFVYLLTAEKYPLHMDSLLQLVDAVPKVLVLGSLGKSLGTLNNELQRYAYSHANGYFIKALQGRDNAPLELLWAASFP